MSFFGFGQGVELEVLLDGCETRKAQEVKLEDGRKELHALYLDGETVSGKVNIVLKKPGVKVEHFGIKIEFLGQIDLFYDRGTRYDFTSIVRELARPGELSQSTSYNFEFNQVEKPYESYLGTNVRLRYLLRLTMVRRITDLVKEVDIAVQALSHYPDQTASFKMEVGIEDCLHIEFEYNKSRYDLRDVIVGKIYFLLVRIKIQHMEIQIIKRETTGSGSNMFSENDTIAKYEIMDGAPVRGENIPIRLFLNGYELTPTMRDVNKKFSVRYYLNLVLVDEEDRRYFKQQEITLFRRADKCFRRLGGVGGERGAGVGDSDSNCSSPSTNTPHHHQHHHDEVNNASISSCSSNALVNIANNNDAGDGGDVDGKDGGEGDNTNVSNTNTENGSNNNDTTTITNSNNSIHDDKENNRNEADNADEDDNSDNKLKGNNGHSKGVEDDLK